jgi:hypothetical protein
MSIISVSAFEVSKYGYYKEDGVFQKQAIRSNNIEAAKDEIELSILQKLETEEGKRENEDAHRAEDGFSMPIISIGDIRNNTEVDEDGNITKIYDPISLDEIQDKEEGFITDCGYFINKKGFLVLALKSENNKSIDCPMCRQSLQVEKYCKKYFQQKKIKYWIKGICATTLFSAILPTTFILYIVGDDMDSIALKVGSIAFAIVCNLSLLACVVKKYLNSNLIN